MDTMTASVREDGPRIQYAATLYMFIGCDFSDSTIFNVSHKCFHDNTVKDSYWVLETMVVYISGS